MIEGLDIANFAGAGIRIESNNDLVTGDYLGTSLSGALAGPGNAVGVWIDDTVGNTIGGTTSATSNLIGFSASAGVSISGNAAAGNLVEGNLIGANPANPKVSLDNHVGVEIDGGAADNTIGGTTVGSANVIGFNSLAGVSISAAAGAGNVVAGNFIGTDSSGDKLGNPVGVFVGGSANTIGGSTTAAGNIIGFSTAAGISISGAAAIHNVVAANDIGTSPTNPTLNQGNAIGLAITGAGNNLIGGTTLPFANDIGFNTSAAVSILGVGATGNLVEGNFVGTSPANTTINQGNTLGVVISGTGVNGNTIGGTATGAGNTIAFNNSDASHGAVTVDTGTGNAILQNLIFNNQGTTLAAAGIDLVNNGNNTQSAPVITGITSVPGTTTISVNLTGAGFTAGADYTLDFFVSQPGDNLSNPVQAHVFLTPAQPFTGGTKGSVVLTIATPLSAGQVVTATATSAAGDTSQFAASVAVTSPFLVTTTADSGTGSLRQAILNVNADTGNTQADTITFDITTGSAPFTIKPTTALPAITHPIIINATTQPGYSGSPIIVIDGSSIPAATPADGLQLANGSKGSAIRGLDIVNFTGTVGSGPAAAIDIQSINNVIQSNDLGVLSDGTTAAANGQGVLVESSANTIGGTTSGAGNVIAENTNDGINITSGNGNAIRQNLIFGNSGNAIDLNNGAANDNLAAPSITAVTSSAGKTNIQGTLQVDPANFPAGTSFIIEFFASGTGTGGTALGPAFTYLGNNLNSIPTPVQVTTDSTGFASFSVTIQASVGVGQQVSATATSLPPAALANDTSEFGTTKSVANPFVVTTTADNGNDTNPIPGSLRQVIGAVNSTPGLSVITFNIPDTTNHIFTILLQSALPDITNPVTIDGTSELTFLQKTDPTLQQALVVVSGDGAVTNGFVLSSMASPPSSSAGSTIDGLEITGFSGDAIQINTSNNTIGGTSSGLGNTITGNTGNAVDVLAGSGNAIRQNLIYGNTGEIVPNPYTNSNDNQAAPAISAVTSVPALTTIDGSVSTAGTYTIEFFANSPPQVSPTVGPAYEYLGSATVTLSASDLDFTVMLTTSTSPIAVPSNWLVVEPTNTFIASGLDSTQTITATLTNANNSTSPFAKTTAQPSQTQSPFEVTNTTDEAAGSAVGSLRLAILNANFTDGADIDFDISGSGLHVITVGSGLTSNLIPLPTITFPVAINGDSQGGGSYTGPPLVEIDGNNGAFDGLTLGAGSSHSTIAGLDITYFGGAGIRIQSQQDTISGNLLGTDLTGKVAGPGNLIGVLIDTGGQATIGGTTSASGNTIGFNTSAGVNISATSPGSSDVIGNYIGTDSAGDNLSNRVGIVVGSQGNTIGGTSTGDANTIAFSSLAGVEITGQPATGNMVQGNYIGTNAGGANLGNATGVIVANGSSTVPSNNLIGATLIDPTTELPIGGNTIGFNVQNGISVVSGLGNAIRENTYTGANGPTLPVESNDIALASSGANNSQSAPILVAAAIPTGGRTLSLRVDEVTANETLEFYVVTPPPAGAAERRTFISNITLVVGGPEDVQISLPPSISISPSTDGTNGSIIVATATDPTNGSSSFSSEIQVFNPFTVTNTEDGQDSSTQGWVGSLRGAIDNANNASGSRPTIVFNIANTGLSYQNYNNGIFTIKLDPTLAVLTIDKPVIIDGASESTFLGQGQTALVVIDGGTTISDGLTLAATSGSDTAGDGSRIDGLGITGFSEAGILVESSNNTIGGIVSGMGNSLWSNSPAASPGSSTANIWIEGSVGSTVTANVVEGNFIGISPSDSTANPGNQTVGVLISGGATNNTIGATSSTIGGTVSGAPNVIGFNTSAGISITGSSTTGNVVLGNFIGTDSADDHLSNGVGIQIDNGASSNVIGGVVEATSNTINVTTSNTVTSAANVIGFNNQAGISIGGTSASPGNSIQGNDIGIDPAHPKNQLDNLLGIVIADGSSGNVVGGLNTTITSTVTSGNTVTITVSNTITGNVIGFNSNVGLSVAGSSNSAIGNYIGTDASGDVLPNDVGIWISGPGKTDTIGGENSLATNSTGNTLSVGGNVIGFNSSAGVSITGSSNTLLGNFVGTDPTGRSLGNLDGVVISGSSNTIGSSVNSTVNSNGAFTNNGNVFSGNSSDGILIQGAAAMSNTILGNTVGGTANGSGVSSPGNLGYGIEISGGSSTTIGSSLMGANGTLGAGANTISGNGVDGIYIQAATTSLNTIEGNLISKNAQNGIDVFGDLSSGPQIAQIRDNFIGTDINGYAAYTGTQTMGNGLSGILLESTSASSISGSIAVSVSGNVISSNGLSGITVENGSSNNTLAAASVSIQDNFIGTDRNGFNVGSKTVPFGNVLDGIRIDGVSGVLIGTSSSPGSTVNVDIATSRGNLISGNLGRGVEIVDGAQGNTIGGNLIGVAFTTVSGSTVVVAQDGNGNDTGNLSDGIFLARSPPQIRFRTPSKGM